MGLGEQVAIGDLLGRTTQFTWDGQGRPRLLTRPDDSRTTVHDDDGGPCRRPGSKPRQTSLISPSGMLRISGWCPPFAGVGCTPANRAMMLIVRSPNATYGDEEHGQHQ